jgi:hypothetical protein
MIWGLQIVTDLGNIKSLEIANPCMYIVQEKETFHILKVV